MPGILYTSDCEDEVAHAEDVEAASGGDIDAVRELVLRAHPDVVPELVRGSSVAELIASVEEARAAYARLETAWTDSRPEAPAVPAGGGAVLPVDPETIPATEKIRRGLMATQRRRA